MKIKEEKPAKLELVGDGKTDDSQALQQMFDAQAKHYSDLPIGPGFVPCRAEIQPDGALRVELLIEPLTAARYRTRAGRMDIGRYLWDNVLHRAIVDAVY